MRAKAVVLLLFLLFVLSNSQAGNQKVLYSFTGGIDGSVPFSGLVFDHAGNLYGTTEFGGAFGLGVVFRLSPSPTGAWTQTVLYSFTGGSDGASPMGGLAIDEAGNLYGGTRSGGDPSLQCGTAFKLSPFANGWNFSVLHTFTGGLDGCSPQADFSLAGGNLVSTTGGGDGADQGTVFRLSTSGGDDEQVAFRGVNGSLLPTPTGAVNEWGYGTTLFGGGAQKGDVYRFICCLRDGGVKIIHAFNTGAPGYYPMGSLATQNVNEVRSMYGANSLGGVGRGGTVYRLTASLYYYDVWNLSVLHSFSGPDGDSPGAGPVFDPAGNLYGTTQFGGADPGYAGTVFRLTPGAKNQWSHNLLYSFSGGADGSVPTSAVTLDSAGNLYGTTISGGEFNQGVVYEIVKTTGLLKPAELTFGPQRRGTTSPPKRISLVNPSTLPVLVSTVNIEGEFDISNNKCQNGVQPKTHCDIFVTYTPTGPGTKPRTGTLTFVDSAFDSPQTASLIGTLPAASRTAVSTSGSPSWVGQPVTFVATVSSTQGAIPDGETVTFSLGPTVLGSVALASGSASLTTSALLAGPHPIKATYAGDVDFDPSFGVVGQVVERNLTTTSVSSSPNPSDHRLQNVVFSANVLSPGPIPTGQVIFTEGTTVLGTARLSSGFASLTVLKSKLTVGTHPITAQYQGDSASDKSTSPLYEQVVY
jgi:uncharacterized repeat protein (TIGR03803 family)